MGIPFALVNNDWEVPILRSQYLRWHQLHIKNTDA